MIQSVAKIDPSRLESELESLDRERNVAEQLTDYIVRQIGKAMQARGVATIAFSGGSTPAEMMRLLAGQKIDWSRVDVTLVDERCVGPEEERSNARLLQQNLLQVLPVKPRFLPLFLEGESDSQRADRLGEMSLPFDLVHLGMGEDAHTASFFPDAENIKEMIDSRAPDLLTTTHSVSSVEKRVTWTLPPLVDASSIVLQIKGDSKKQVFLSACNHLAQASTPEQIELVHKTLPISAVMYHRDVVIADGHRDIDQVDKPFAVFYE